MDYKLPKRVENSNKSTYGRVLNIAGSDYMPGAAYLSSVSALKIGCGYCFLVSTERVIDSVAAQTQNVVFVPRKDVLSYLSEADIVEIGCGLSQKDDAVNLFQAVVDNFPKNLPLIVDADGLNILSKMPEFFTAKKLKNVILTPHPKEAARLLDCSLEDILKDIEKAAYNISQIYNAITVLKVHKTVVVAPCLLNTYDAADD
ncbi:MAG: NAD(P)H-hydrate dehydratase [Candidatus Gastranaerophilales bacterium]|nr:NAD(P)H-hydrate dehydratase [Candidatus Gastranaerophilales bacterium]